MPFERYLQAQAAADPRAAHNAPAHGHAGHAADSPLSPHHAQDGYNHYDARGHMHSAAAGDPSTSSNNSAAGFAGQVQFQMPQFMYAGPPTLAPGGGAEVLAAGLYGASSSITNSWLANNGFSTNFPPVSAPPPIQPHAAQTQSQPVAAPYQLTASASDGFVRNQQQQQQQQQAYGTSASASSSSLSLSRTTLGDSSSSFDWFSSPIPTSSSREFSDYPPTSTITAPSALGLPVYSASGFDLLSILARVIARPNPKIVLGPVDMTCSFVVVDVRRYDSPIVYASPTFCALTGYEENEVLGRNCRFLQSPEGRVNKGEERRYTAPDAVGLLRKSLAGDKEVQTSLVNYKKGGQAFINLVTVIPVAGGLANRPEEKDEIVYHIGFQVDLTQQPNAILQRLKDGSYIVNYSSGVLPATNGSLGGRRAAPISHSAMSAHLRTMLSEPAFLRSIPLTTTPNMTAASDRADAYDDNQLLDMLLLERLPDFVHVLSLKGVFLYAAPSVRRVLGYEPDELVGKSVADFCHPSDLVPLMRELKESSSATPPGEGPGSAVAVPAVAGAGGVSQLHGPPKTVDLLFRARAKSGAFVWVECRGRLHVEPGKGRKAIVLSGRTRGMPALPWERVRNAGGLAACEPAAVSPHAGLGLGAGAGGARAEEREFWAKLSAGGMVLFVGAAVKDVLGWGVVEVIGRRLGDFVDVGHGPEGRQRLERTLADASRATVPVGAGVEGEPGERPARMQCRMRTMDGRVVGVEVVVHRSRAEDAPRAERDGHEHEHTRRSPSRPAPQPVIVQVKVVDAATDTGAESQSAELLHPLDEDLFDELHTRRGTSWQYELQQLKYANQRLQEEVDGAEAEAAREMEGERDEGAHVQGRRREREHAGQRAPQRRASSSASASSTASSGSSGGGAGPSVQDWSRRSFTLKRAWDTMDGGGMT